MTDREILIELFKRYDIEIMPPNHVVFKTKEKNEHDNSVFMSILNTKKTSDKKEHSVSEHSIDNDVIKECAEMGIDAEKEFYQSIIAEIRNENNRD